MTIAEDAWKLLDAFGDDEAAGTRRIAVGMAIGWLQAVSTLVDVGMPHVASNDAGEVTLEWWGTGTNKLTLWFEVGIDHVEYVWHDGVLTTTDDVGRRMPIEELLARVRR